MTPGSVVRLASVARHVTDCATRPCEKVLDETYLVKINNVFRHPASDSLKLHAFVFIH